MVTAQRTAGLGYQDDNVRQDYTGYERDDESGLEYAQARYYNPAHGRFTSPAPLTASASIRNPQTFNRYSYVLNSPYKFTDPLGLLSVSTGACGQFCNGGLDGGGVNPLNGASYIMLGRQDAEAPDPPPVVTTQNGADAIIQTETRTYEVVQTENDGRQATVTVTSTVTRTIDSTRNRQIGVDSDPNVTSTAINTGQAEFQTSDLNTMAQVARDIVYVALRNKMSPSLFLAMAQRETHLGRGAIGDSRNVGKPEMGASINPLQLDGDANLKYYARADNRLFNIEMSMRLFNENATASRATSLIDSLSVYNSGKFANRSTAGSRYATDITRKIAAIRETIKTTQRPLF